MFAFNAIWGRYFPHFCEKETRLFESDELEQMISATPRLRMEDVKFFRYQRASSLGKLTGVYTHVSHLLRKCYQSPFDQMLDVVSVFVVFLVQPCSVR